MRTTGEAGRLWRMCGGNGMSGRLKIEETDKRTGDKRRADSDGQPGPFSGSRRGLLHCKEADGLTVWGLCGKRSRGASCGTVSP
jgi:hypothetical protein